ncbi:hypothetical protein CMESO_407 (nucleomorph) [Chroomonas mesostigmatica CCMP1168]|uniref:Uncharacterized protein n=1 Tax=Chroomonas mesostigmatica CCMP1168 TaxID=1195612 RepID=J7GAS5_9CRYP|nr:hypothetical protein CMESO_407 [Chroomonas mesostigmatica CCMP1168]
MNISCFISYSFYGFTEKIEYNSIQNHFSKIFFWINSLSLANDLSLFSFQFLNLFYASNFQENIFLENKRCFLKKEILILINEFFWILRSFKKFKNFNLWHHLHWIKEKENFFTYIPKEITFWKFFFVDLKNYQIWTFFFKSLFKKGDEFWIKIIFLEISDSFDINNYGNWNLRFLFYFISKKLSREYSKILIKKRYDHKITLFFGFFFGLLSNSKITNSILITYFGLLKIEKSTINIIGF